MAWLVGAFLVSAVLIGAFGVVMTRTARDLAHRTGLGEALVGAVLIGAATSLSGITTSVTAAWTGHAELAVSNALGGIATQTAFLAIADIFYRRANLEHAAASVENLMMCAFLLILLAVHLAGIALPAFAIYSVHPATIVLFGAYFLGLRLLVRAHRSPMWLPRRTVETSRETQDPGGEHTAGLPVLWLRFLACAAVVAAAGWLLARVAVPVADRTGLSEGFVGGTFTAISTSLPELIIAVSAVRMRALNLAVGDIVGGNAFDTLFIAVSDVAYRQGSIYAAIGAAEQFWLAITVMMTGILLTGLLFRERHGIGNIGFESLLLIIVYLGGATVVAVAT
jgi:cation:H+ antiporter